MYRSTQFTICIAVILLLSSVLSLVLQSYILAFTNQNKSNQVRQSIVTSQLDSILSDNADGVIERLYSIVPEGITLIPLQVSLASAVFSFLFASIHIPCAWYLSKRPDHKVRTRAFHMVCLFMAVFACGITITAFIFAQKRAQGLVVDVSDATKGVTVIGNVGLEPWVCYLAGKNDFSPGVDGQSVPDFGGTCKIASGGRWALIPCILLAFVQCLMTAWAWCSYEIENDQARAYLHLNSMRERGQRMA